MHPNVYLNYLSGNPEGICICTMPFWTGIALFFPISELGVIKKTRDEINRPGVYILIGPNEDGGIRYYIGEGDTVRQRLEAGAKEKEWCERVIVFVSADHLLHKTMIQYLESRMIQVAQASSLSSEQRREDPPTIDDYAKVQMDNFFEKIVFVTKIFNLSIFSQYKKNDPETNKQNLNIEEKDRGVLRLVIRHEGDILAKASFENGVFTVLSGSMARLENDNSSLQTRYRMERENLIKDGVLESVGEGFLFKKNWIVSSATKGSSVILGRSSSGNVDWVDESDNRTKLGDLLRFRD